MNVIMHAKHADLQIYLCTYTILLRRTLLPLLSYCSATAVAAAADTQVLGVLLSQYWRNNSVHSTVAASGKLISVLEKKLQH